MRGKAAAALVALAVGVGTPSIAGAPPAAAAEAAQPARQLLRKNLCKRPPCEAASASQDYSISIDNVASADTRAGVRAAAKGDLKLAEAIFAQQVAKDPSASAFSNLGNVELQLGKYEDAERNFDEAHARAPDAPVPLLNRCIALMKLDRLPEAAASCEAATALDAEEYAAWHNLGDVRKLQGRPVEAAKAYGAASLLAPGVAGYRLKWALALYEARLAAESEGVAKADVPPLLAVDQAPTPTEAAAAASQPAVARALQLEEDPSVILGGLVRKYPAYAEARAARAALTLATADPEDMVRAEERAATDVARAVAAQPELADIRFVLEELGWSDTWASMWKVALEL